MKTRKINKRLKRHYKKKLYCRLTRKVGKFEGITRGYIVGVSKDFVLLQESDDFKLYGYVIIPRYSIIHFRYNKFDKKYQQILEAEKVKLKFNYTIDLKSWKSICKDLKKTKLTVISECEHPKLDYFCIGKIKKVNKKSLSIRYFDAAGILDKDNTEHKYKEISKLRFDDHYANVFSKYLIKIS